MDADNLQYALGLALGIVIWFLKGVMSDFKALKSEVTNHDREIGIIKSEQTNSLKLFEKLDSKLDKSFEALSAKIDAIIMSKNNND